MRAESTDASAHHGSNGNGDRYTPNVNTAGTDSSKKKSSGGYGYGGGGGSDAPSITNTTVTSDPSSVNVKTNEGAAETTKGIVEAARNGIDDVSIDKIDHIDTTYQKNLIEQLTQAQKDQANLAADHTIKTGTTELQRNMQDAQSAFQTQRDQIDRDEQRALDNQVLSAAARGDRGGIGQAQYNSIQNTAAVNRLNVQKEQTKLATDTNRQIADLRAKGEFERADALLNVTQNYLSQLLDLEQYAQTTNLGIDEFNKQLEEFEANYKLSVNQYLTNTELSAAEATGAFSNGTMTQSAFNTQVSQIQSAVQMLMSMGIAPTTEQLAYLGMNATQANDYTALTRWANGY